MVPSQIQDVKTWIAGLCAPQGAGQPARHGAHLSVLKPCSPQQRAGEVMQGWSWVVLCLISIGGSAGNCGNEIDQA